MAKSRNLKINEVEEYLKENINKNLSLRKIYRDLNIKRRKAIWLINKSNCITKVKPCEVGSGKYSIHVYTYSN